MKQFLNKRNAILVTVILLVSTITIFGIIEDKRGVFHNKEYTANNEPSYEKLKIYSSNKGKGTRFNKQVNNDWHRGIFVNSLHKWLGIINCKWVEIIPEYSSYIGCIMYENETDSIAASIELNRRLREYKSIYIDKTKSKGNIVYPLFTMSHFNRWKESLDDRVFKDWKESYQWFKETKHSYRLTYPLWLKHNDIRPFRYKSFKSMINHVII